MNRKSLILLLMLILLVPFAFSYMCLQESITPCTVQTPVITCNGNYNYTVYNSDGVISQQGNMSTVGGQIYNFTLNVPINSGYVIRLCNNMTAMINVIPYEAQNTDKGVLLLALLISEFMLVLFFLYFSYVLEGDTGTDSMGNKVEKFVILRLFLVLVSLIWVFKTYSSMTFIVESYIGLSNLIIIAGLSVYTWIFYIFISVYLFITLFYVLSIIQQKKANAINF